MKRLILKPTIMACGLFLGAANLTAMPYQTTQAMPSASVFLPTVRLTTQDFANEQSFDAMLQTKANAQTVLAIRQGKPFALSLPIDESTNLGQVGDALQSIPRQYHCHSITLTASSKANSQTVAGIMDAANELNGLQTVTYIGPVKDPKVATAAAKLSNGRIATFSGQWAIDNFRDYANETTRPLGVDISNIEPVANNQPATLGSNSVATLGDKVAQAFVYNSASLDPKAQPLFTNTKAVFIDKKLATFGRVIHTRSHLSA